MGSVGPEQGQHEHPSSPHGHGGCGQDGPDVSSFLEHVQTSPSLVGNQDGERDVGSVDEDDPPHRQAAHLLDPIVSLRKEELA